MTEQETVSAATWRVAQAASNVRDVVERNATTILGVAEAGQALEPAVEEFLLAVDTLRKFNNVRKVADPRYQRAIEALHRRTLFWLTYVRLDAPGYATGEVTGKHKGGKVVIDRAAGVLGFARELPVRGMTSVYAEALLTELTPLFEQANALHTELELGDLEEQRLKAEVRRLMVPVYRGLTPLRILLRNALGATHLDVRALNVEPPAKSKKKDKAKAA